MITLSVCPVFKGTKKEFAKVLLMCLCFDALIFVSAINLY